MSTTYNFDHSELFGLKIANLTMGEALVASEELLLERQAKAIFTPNASMVNKAIEEPNFLKVLQSANSLLPDGMSLVIASRILKRPLKEKVSGSSFFVESINYFGNRGYKAFIIGAAEGVADKAKQNLVSLNPRVNIVGTYSPILGFEKSEEERLKMINIINSNKPDVLYFALPDGKGEQWIIENMYNYHPCLNIQIGAAVDFVAGIKSMPPRIFKKFGIAWFWRLMAEPFPRKKKIILDNIMIIKNFYKYYKYEKSLNNRS